jgi:hypothetical protein
MSDPNTGRMHIGFLDRIALAIGSGLMLISAVVILWPGGLTDKIAEMPPGGIRTSLGVGLGLLALVSIWWMARSLKSDYCRTIAAEIRALLLKEREELELANENAHEVLEDLRRLRAGLAPLLDKVEESKWYLSWEQFKHHEAELRSSCQKRNTAVTAYIVSRTLKFDTDKLLLPQVKKNLACGADYFYIIPDDIKLTGKKQKIEYALANANIANGSKTGTVGFVSTRDGSLFAEIAIFRYEKTCGDDTHAEVEAFMAIEDSADIETPWLRLGPDRTDSLYGTVIELLKRESSGSRH